MNINPLLSLKRYIDLVVLNQVWKRVRLGERELSSPSLAQCCVKGDTKKGNALDMCWVGSWILVGFGSRSRDWLVGVRARNRERRNGGKIGFFWGLESRLVVAVISAC